MAQLLRAKTTLGDFQGIQCGNAVQFRNVPYSAPPVGKLRFAPPHPVAAWTGIRDAGQHGPIPPQLPSRLSNVMGDFSRPQDEDCLTLTITTPAVDNKARPVLVWLHGGAYLSGAGSLDWYDGTTLAHEGDVVVVGVNYRLGALGFLYQPEISNGKLGILDIIAALQWVKEHIRGFGGDPNQVTVMGQSAGAHAIMYMLAQPEASQLFQRAILQSAPAGLPPSSEASALANGNQFLDLLHIEQGHPAKIAAQLQAESPTRIIEAVDKLASANARFGQVDPPFMPVFDELSTPKRFIEAAAEGAGRAGIDLIIGTAREESNSFFNAATLPNPDPALIAERFATLAGHESVIEEYRHRRPGASMVQLLSDLVTDYAFLFPSLQFAESASKAGSRVWVYQFDWSPSNSPLAACHCIEIPFVFGTLQMRNSAPMLQGADEATLIDLSKTIRNAWTDFAHKGDPAIHTPWPQYQESSRQTMRFADVIGPVGDLAGVTWRTSFVS